MPRSSFEPEDAPSRFRTSVSIDAALAQCDGAQPRRSLQEVLTQGVQRDGCSGRNRLSLEGLACELQCDAEEPELERAFRLLRTSKLSLESMAALCKQGAVSALIWVHGNVPKYFVCGGKERVQGATLFGSTKRLLTFLSCVAELPDVLFALDNSDWAVPLQDPGGGHAAGWLQPLPGVARYTGSASHPALLLPSDAFVLATTHCDMGHPSVKAALRVCRSMDQHSVALERPFRERRDVVFWRGSSTGVPLAPVTERYLPRPALIRNFFDEPGFDVGFVGGPPPASLRSYRGFFDAHRRDRVHQHELADSRFVLHCDGHTASWGLAQKLTTRSLVVWIASNFKYREFYYAHLRPWEHFLPADADLSNLPSIRDWLLKDAPGAGVAEAIAGRARALFETRLRPEATYCYLARLLWSLKEVQLDEPTPSALRELGIDVSKFRTFEDIEGFL